MSIGHKDSENVFRKNTMTGNKKEGVYWRRETKPSQPTTSLLKQHGARQRGVGIIRRWCDEWFDHTKQYY